MNEYFLKKKADERPSKDDRIEGDKIIIDGRGQFPKEVVILIEGEKIREYRLVKTRNGGYVLN